ncbi:transcriptional regulator [Curtobacterium sp. MCBD17_019]|uniref:transcriptional regulator n=1 Tax=Curtobacterium sp. MCBD17_019 TaxID=2175669 RepID=UPI000DA72605|nr:transcriptional regulator [Curtobacterium sp. MCBD17_019]PZE78429.1 transcriptional regulator [Curtobacterium sp. MCBD17_019]
MTEHPRHRLVAELMHPLRLSIVAKIVGNHSIAFRDLRDVLDVSDSTLSKQCAILEAAGVLTVTKAFVGKTPRTRFSLSAEGETQWAGHRAALCELIGVEAGPL